MSPQKNKQKETLDKVASIILAGGQGTRLHPLTLTRCKPAVCFGGRYRLVDIPISNSLNAQIHRIFVISQYFASSLQQHILETYQLDYFRQSKIQMLCPEETPTRKLLFKGTADAVRQNLEHFENANVDYFLILSGDQLYNMNFTDMLDFAKKTDADLVIAALPVETNEAKRMGLLKIDASCRIQEFHEKPTDPAILKRYELSDKFLEGHNILHPEETHYLGSMGIYIFKREALFALLKEKGDDFGKDLIPAQVKKGKTAGYVYKGYWEDIGTVASYYNANLALTARKNCLNTYDEHNPIFTHPHNLPSPLINDTNINHSIISQGSVIEAEEITNSIVGIRIQIKKGTVIRDSIILGSLYNDPYLLPNFLGARESVIGENCRIEKTILDEHTSVGNNVQLINKDKLQNYDGDGIFIRDGIIIVTSGTKLPDGFIL
ncbi:MAG: glucose-1-phosphate adenylyltransferase [Candidatus Melainabacteria bacterium]|nr:glucose-1-phosphate adenylyltransferase [Candidatus Melainabacteria bacterium]